MKNFYAILCLAIASLTQLQAQAPQGFNYQATVRNSSGDLIVNTNVYFKFNVIQGSQTAVPIFTETHYVPTDDLGQVNLIIGQGTANTGSFSALDWSLGSYYLGIELDTGDGYVAMGTTQLLSVPYALYAENTGNSTPTTPNLETVLAENNSANNQQIKNLQDPTDAQDAVTKDFLLEKLSLLQDQIDALQASTGSGTVTDQDGNSYPYLTYGDQIWTVKNADVVTYRDGTTIPQVTDATEWSNLTTGAWCYFDNDPTKGKLYNWFAVMGIHDNDENTPNKEFAPEGWHVPTDAEWTTLENYLISNGYNYDGATSGNKIAKAMASTTGWTSSTIDGAIGNNQSLNNRTGFNAIPEGYRAGIGSFTGEGPITIFWSSTQNSTNNAWGRYMNNSYIELNRSNYNKQLGVSVRFVRGLHPNDIDNDNDGYTENQGDCDDTDASTYPGATELADGKDNDCDGEIDEDLETSTVTDQDGNTYEFKSYGDQTWSVENAEMVTYRDGTEIPQVTDATEWDNLTTGAWCYFDNDPTKGKLYNWFAVMGIHDNDENTPNKEFAPEGWHVPTDAEWTTLENYLISNGYNYDGATSGNKIAKAMASTTGWTSSTIDGAIGNNQSLNNRTGFNAIPEGYRAGIGSFTGEGPITIFWSSTQNSTNNAWGRYMNNSYIELNRSNYNKQLGVSVRFVRGLHPNDIDNDNDGYTENQGDCDDTDASTYPGATELADGKDNDCDGEIDEDLETSTVTDQDGNTYEFKSYGDQNWSVENAEMVTYRDGTVIPQVTDNTEWSNLTTGAWCYYDNDSSKGKLYNWYAVAGIHDTDPNTPNKELAPDGWHVPRDVDWTILEEHLIANGYNYDDTTTENKIAKAMASNTGWNSSTVLGAIGNDQSLNNSSGFNAFPEGYRNYDGSFNYEGYDAIFWSSTESNSGNAWYRYLFYNTSDLYRGNFNKQVGFSVRFVRD